MPNPFLSRLLSEADALHARGAAPGAPPPSTAVRGWLLFRGLIGYFLRRFNENNITALAAALCYQTIFALIPLLALAFLGAKSLGTLEDSKHSLHGQLAQWGLAQIAASDTELGGRGSSSAPAPRGAALRPPDSRNPAPGDSASDDASPAGDSVKSPAEPRTVSLADQIIEQVEAVEGKLTFNRLGPIGTILLIWTALTLLSTIERSLNRILGAPDVRSSMRRMLLYWSVVTLGPIMVAVASYMGDQTVATFKDALGMGRLLAAIGWLGPIFVGVVALSLVYKLMPGMPVRLGPALFGATTAIVLFQLAKWGFAVYVLRLVVNGNLYGVLGLLPLFFLWLNLSWLIFLFGAELVGAAMNPQRVSLLERVEHRVVVPADLLAAAVLVGRRFVSGGGPLQLDEARQALSMPPEMTVWVYGRLAAANLVCEIRQEENVSFTLARPPERIAVDEVLALADSAAAHAPDAASPRGDNGRSDPVIAGVARRMRDSLGSMTLGDLLEENAPSGGYAAVERQAGA